MNQTTWLQERRVQKFPDVLSRSERRELSALGEPAKAVTLRDPAVEGRAIP